ncbi:MAG: component of SufBCD complex [Roseinatronobacter sp.]
MDILENLMRVIDLRSFGSIWFWIVVALFWSAVTQTILGASYDLIVRARRSGGQSLSDLHALVEIQSRRMTVLMDRVGHWIVAFVGGGLALTFMLAFAYRIELAQAIFVLLLPLSIIRILTLRLAYRIQRQNLRGDLLIRALLRHRFWLQLLGVVTIFTAATWGMLRVMNASVLGM